MARAAVLGRLTWQVATVQSARTETATARTLVLGVPEWPGHLPGQHVDLRLTAADGYSNDSDPPEEPDDRDLARWQHACR